jgi:hypothetical protein
VLHFTSKDWCFFPSFPFCGFVFFIYAWLAFLDNVYQSRFGGKVVLVFLSTFFHQTILLILAAVVVTNSAANKALKRKNNSWPRLVPRAV